MLITFAQPIQHSIYNVARKEYQLRMGGEPRFVAFASYKEKDQLRAAGFSWDKQLRVPDGGGEGHWFTLDAAIAARLAPYCDEVAAPLVRDLVISRKASRQAAADVVIPAPAGMDYFPFQKAGILYAKEREATLIADEMGLGKTIQAIGVINATDPMPQRVLVVCPASVKANWRRELNRWLVHPLSVGIATPRFVPPANVVIINYDILRKHSAYLGSVEWDVLIVDECHYVKNPETIRGKGIFGGSNAEERKAFPGIKAKRRLFLTGTPIVNRPSEIWPLLVALDPGRWQGKKSHFTRRYLVFGSKNAGKNLEELQDVLRSTIMVRRMKSDVMKELPPKRRQIFEMEPTPEMRDILSLERQAYESAKGPRIANAGSDDEGLRNAIDNLKDGESVGLEDLSRLRHETALAKVPLVIAHVKELMEETDKLILFAHHTDVLEQLEAGLRDYGPLLLTGKTPIAQRQVLVDQFQTRDDRRIFVASMLAAGVGLTLTAANTVVFAELDWVPGNIKQAEDRAHRIGSEIHESILIQYLVVEESLDAYIAQTVAEKLAVIERTLDREAPKQVAEPAEEIGGLAVDTSGKRAVGVVKHDPYARERLLKVEGLSVESAAAIHQCLRILAGNDPDGAREENGVGFNRLDSSFGHHLALTPVLTPRQASAGRRLLVKYRRQLPEQLYCVATGKEPVRA